MKRGDVYWAELNPRSGSEQRDRRPVIVVSHDGFDQTPQWCSIIVVPLATSESQAKRGPTAIPVTGVVGLHQSSVALCHQVTTLDRAKLTEWIGELPPDLLTKIAEGLKVAMDLD